MGPGEGGRAEPRPCPCCCHRPEVGTEAGGQTLEGVRVWEPCSRGVGWGADPGGSAQVSAEAVALWAHRGCCRSSGDRREDAGSVGSPRSSELNKLLQGRSLG